MNQTTTLLNATRGLGLVLFGAFVFLAPHTELSAQNKGKDKEADKAVEQAPQPEAIGRVKPRALVREGYTRPGKPDTKFKPNGDILPLAGWQKTYEGKIIGGTVYFAVYERSGAEGDTWGTGMPNLDETFVEGRSFNNTFSPPLDTKARYLYLYQVVNDRGLDPGKKGTAFALGEEIRSEDVASATVRLLVDPRYITSWGHFRTAGFTLRVLDRQLNGQAAAGDKEIRMAVSANPSILRELPYKRYTSRSPAYPLAGNLGKSLMVNTSNLNLAKSAAYQQLAKRKGVKGAAWEKSELAAAEDGGKNPAFVQLMFAAGPDGNPELIEENGEVFPAVFRADWQGDNVLKLGVQSTIFGFTTDLPPTDELVRITDPVDAVKGDGIRQAANATGTAPGTVPTPMAPVAAPPTGGGGGAGSFGMPFGGGSGFPGRMGIGGIGAGTAGFGGGGGGLAGGGSNGSGNGQPSTAGTTGTTSTTGTNTGTNTGTPTQTQSVTVSPIFNNSNSQSQAQSQAQIQAQSQAQTQTNTNTNTNTNCCPNMHGEVVPEPGAIILGLLGLPVFYLMRRRKPALPGAAA